MSGHPKALAIIPARGGSKGVPRKNCIDVCGRPLIAYTIEAALRCGRFDRVIVSTDDEEISAISQRYGAEVPVLRPKELAGDKSPLASALNHMHAFLASQGFVPDIVAHMYPTHPFRSLAVLRGLMDKLASGYSRVLVGRAIGVTRNSYLTIGADSTLRRASLPAQGTDIRCLRPYGLFDGWRRGGGGLGMYVHRIDDVIGLIDIDDPEDLELARYVVANNLWSLE